MPIVSFQFSIFAVLGACVFWCVPHRWKSHVFALLNIVFIAHFGKFSSLLPLVLFILGCFVFFYWVQNDRRTWVLGVCVAIVISAFVYLKKYSFIDFISPLSAVYVTVGLSYILFRILHLIVDAQNQALPQKIGFLSFFSYTCHFLSFVSGPIQRFQDYAEQMAELRRPGRSDLEIAAYRIFKGLFKSVVLGELVFMLHKATLVFDLDTFRAIDFVVPAHLYTLYLYLNFSGYTDIVLGWGRVFGLKLPENFQSPFHAKNFLDLWSRWHISLSDWFKTYVFNPIVTALGRRWKSPKWSPYWGVIGYFVTFLIMGIWHGSTSVFVFYGAYLGLGVSVNKLYQILIRKILNREQVRSLVQNAVYSWLCTGLTISYFSLGLACFWVNTMQIVVLKTRIDFFSFLKIWSLSGIGTALILFIITKMVVVLQRRQVFGLS